MGDDLKPCPFCGVSNTYIESGLLDGRYSEEKWFQVQCQECCAVGSSRSAECDAVEAWNNAGSARAKAAEQRAEALAAEVAQARAEGAAVERAAVVAYIKTHRDIADKRGGQHVGTGPNPSVQRFMLRILVPDLECGEHTRH